MSLVQLSAESNNLPRVHQLLDAHRPKAGEDDLRGFEWWYWDRRARSELSTAQLALPEPYRNVRFHWQSKFSEDGRFVAGWVATRVPRGGVEAVHYDNCRLKVWNAAGGQQIFSHPLQQEAGPFWSWGPVFSRDGRRVGLSWGTEFVDNPHDGGPWFFQRNLCVLEAPTGKELLAIREKSGDLYWEFSPDGGRAAVHHVERGTNLEWLRSTITMWNLADGKALFRIGDVKDTFSHPQFSRDGKRIVASVVRKGAPDRIVVWDAWGGKELAAWPIEGAYFAEPTFSPNGDRLAAVVSSQDGKARAWRVKTWDSATGKELQSFPLPSIESNPRYPSSWAFFSPDGSRLAACFRKDAKAPHEMKVWEAESGKELFTCVGNGDRAAFSHDGRLLASYDETLARNDDDTVHVRDAATGEVRLTYQARHAIKALTFSADGRLHAVDEKCEVKVWNATGDERPIVIPAARPLADRVDIRPDCRHVAWIETVAAGDEKRQVVKVWDVAGAKEVHQLPLRSGASRGARAEYDPSGRYLVCNRGLQLTIPDNDPLPDVTIWDADTGREVFYRQHTDRMVRLTAAVDPEGRRIALGFGDHQQPFKRSRIEIIDLQSGKELRRIDLPVWTRIIPAFSPDGRRVAAMLFRESIPGEMHTERRVWDAGTGRELLSIPDDSTGFQLAWSPDGMALAANVAIRRESRSHMKIWDSTSGAELLTLSGQSGLISGLAFSSDGKRVATCYSRRAWSGSVVAIWDAVRDRDAVGSESRQALLELRIDQPYAFARFSPDGRRLFAAGSDGEKGITIHVWDATPRPGPKQP
jgi:WD40 repeat protein